MLEVKDRQYLIDEAIKFGANRAKIISASSIKVGGWTRMKCQYGCANYGKTLCCPPYVPTYEQTKKFIAEFDEALLVEYVAYFDVDSQNWKEADKQMSNALLDVLVKVERAAVLKNYYKAFALKAGRCYLCDTCNLERCVHPDKARPSAEACGIDVMALATQNGYEAEILTGPTPELKVYGLVLID